MPRNISITHSKKISNKVTTSKMILALSTLILFGSGYCFSQSNKTGKTMKATINDIKTKKTATAYLEKNDPIFITIKDRAVTDLKQSSVRSDPESNEDKLIATQIKTWTKEKQNKLQALVEQSINDYTAKTHFDVGTFMMVFSEFGKMDQKKIAEEYDIRIQDLGDDKYVAEFWEDGLAVNSEANALISAHELATSEYAKKHPDSGIGNVEVVKKTYANVRKSIQAGVQERYTKVMVLLYTLDKDGLITFHDPFQSVIDFIKE
ncbi:MAG: hypothetical protein ACYDA4_15840 [Ignavibacteriaceae bacterium]